MFTWILLIKFTVAISSVVGLSILFEKINPKIAGLLSGYPVGVALALFFFGLENGADFASESAVFNIVGILTFLSFIGIYYIVSKVFSGKKGVIAISTMLATAGFLLISYGLEQIEFGIISSIVFAIVTIIAFMIPFQKIRIMQTGSNADVTLKSILVKAFVASSIITLVTALANSVGPAWAGLLASFPATTLPLILLVHYKYSTMHLHALFKYIPVGSFSIVAYVAAVYYVYPEYGIYFGTLIAYAAATIPILLLYYIEHKNLLQKLFNFLHMADKSTIHFIMTGGTIDFHYSRRHDTTVPNKKSAIPEFIEGLEYIKAHFTELFIKDSRKLSDSDFDKILKTIKESPYDKIVITAGTFKLDKLAKFIADHIAVAENSKTIILTGSTTPIEGIAQSEALFNLGYAVSSAQNLKKGIYINFFGEVYTQNDIERLVKEGGLAAIFQASEVPTVL
jgi:uncharacterized membrane protein (GlpM family)